MTSKARSALHRFLSTDVARALREGMRVVARGDPVTRTLDPASLHGEALTRWYQRSPQDIELERQTLADDRYAAFFGAPQPKPTIAARPAAAAVSPLRGQRAGWRSAATAPAPQRPGLHDCVSCHGRAPPPPPVFPWPARPMPPAMRDAPSTPRGEPPKGPPKQCDIQHRNDTETCGRQPNNVARAMCRESAMERYTYCIKSKGEVGHPRLFTHPDAPR